MKPFEPEQLPPQDLDLLALIPLIGKANRAVATLEGLFYGIPNPNVLLSPITTQEAVLSSKIEGTQADLEDVLKFEAGEAPMEASRQEDIHEILNYRKALHLSEKLLEERPFCLKTLLKLHGQFEILHPFIDGNGRLGRMIIPLFLYEKKILTRPCFYLSAYFEAGRDEYVARLRELGQPGSWTRWCAYFLEGVAVQAQANTTKARAIQDLYERLKRQVLELTHSQFTPNIRTPALPGWRRCRCTGKYGIFARLSDHGTSATVPTYRCFPSLVKKACSFAR